MKTALLIKVKDIIYALIKATPYLSTTFGMPEMYSSDESRM